MKTMTCRQLGGSCDLEFHAETFEDMERQSKEHGMAMFQAGDEGHLRAMHKMKALLPTPEAMTEWFDGKREEFDSLPENG